MVNTPKMSMPGSPLSRIDSTCTEPRRIKRFRIFQYYSKATYWYGILIYDENSFELLHGRNSKLNYESNLLRVQFECPIFGSRSNPYYTVNLMIWNDTSRNFEALKFKSMMMK